MNAGIQTLIDDKHAIAHNKVMVIDSTTVITGSFNFTKAAEERNAENLLVIKEAPELVQAYTQTSWRMQPTRTPIRGQLLRHLVLRPQHLIAMARCMGTATVKCTRVPSCKGYAGMDPASVVAFASEAEAQQAGYRKAKDCR